MTTDSLPRQMGRCVCSFVTPPLEAERVEALTAFVARRKAKAARRRLLSALPPHDPHAPACRGRRDVLRVRHRRWPLGRRLRRDPDSRRRRRGDVRHPLDRLYQRVSHLHVGGRRGRAPFRRRSGALRLGYPLWAALCALLDASSEAWVAIALIVAGFLGGIVDLLMNAEGARIERRLGRPILARLHAAASAGMALGAILGSLIAASAAPWAAGLLAALVARACRRRLSSGGAERFSRSGASRGVGAKRIVLCAGSDWTRPPRWACRSRRNWRRPYGRRCCCARKRRSWRRFPASARRSFPPARLRCASTPTQFVFASAIFASSSLRS